MGVEIQNNFVDGLYCENLDSDSKCHISGSESDYCSLKNVKQCLKSKVIGSLKSRGFKHIAADFSPKPNYPMTAEEIEKDKRRKQSNRDSARKSRERQKEEDSKNRKLLSQLKKDKEKLLEVVKNSEEEKNKLLHGLKLILPDSYIAEALKKVPEVTEVQEHLLTEQYPSCEEITSTDSPNTSENYILEDGSYILTSLDGFTGEGTITGIVDYLEVASEETVQVVDFNYDENEIVQSVVYEDDCVSQTLI